MSLSSINSTNSTIPRQVEEIDLREAQTSASKTLQNVQQGESEDLLSSESEEAVLQSRGYRAIKKLGEGTYAKVYLFEHIGDEGSEDARILACKIIDTSKTTPSVLRKFLPRELDILLKLNHPHIIQVYSIFQRRTKYFVFMQAAENGDLLTYILQSGAVNENQARIWFRQLALGIQYLHEMEIAHRDIKCENVLMTSNNDLKLTDFGFSRYMIDIRGKRVLSDTYCGSISYVAPEILKAVPYNPKVADVWSLGIILYVMLNRGIPFDNPNTRHLYQLQVNRKWRFRTKIAPLLSEKLKLLMNNLLEPDVTRRYKIDQVVYSDWIAMDPKLSVLTPAEQNALNSAIEERKKNEEKFKKQNLNVGGKVTTNQPIRERKRTSL